MSESSGVCPLCGKEVRQLSQHMLNVHEEKEVPCEVCNKNFKSVMLKINHMNNTHGIATSCVKCEITFPSNAYILKLLIAKVILYLGVTGLCIYNCLCTLAQLNIGCSCRGPPIVIKSSNVIF